MTARAREIAARIIGAAVALSIMVWAWRSIGWPAPGVAVASGMGAYLLLRPGRLARHRKR